VLAMNRAAAIRVFEDLSNTLPDAEIVLRPSRDGNGGNGDVVEIRCDKDKPKLFELENLLQTIRQPGPSAVLRAIRPTAMASRAPATIAPPPPLHFRRGAHPIAASVSSSNRCSQYRQNNSGTILSGLRVRSRKRRYERASRTRAEHSCNVEPGRLRVGFTRRFEPWPGPKTGDNLLRRRRAPRRWSREFFHMRILHRASWTPRCSEGHRAYVG